jgi:methylase of polypeptide subunit release factors
MKKETIEVKHDGQVFHLGIVENMAPFEYTIMFSLDEEAVLLDDAELFDEKDIEKDDEELANRLMNILLYTRDKENLEAELKRIKKNLCARCYRENPNRYDMSVIFFCGGIDEDYNHNVFPTKKDILSVGAKQVKMLEAIIDDYCTGAYRNWK